jgi:hypothetical protein
MRAEIDKVFSRLTERFLLLKITFGQPPLMNRFDILTRSHGITINAFDPLERNITAFTVGHVALTQFDEIVFFDADHRADMDFCSVATGVNLHVFVNTFRHFFHGFFPLLDPPDFPEHALARAKLQTELEILPFADTISRSLAC